MVQSQSIHTCYKVFLVVSKPRLNSGVLVELFIFKALRDIIFVQTLLSARFNLRFWEIGIIFI